VVVELVFTERRRDLTPQRARNLDRLRELVARTAAASIGVSHYEDVDGARLERADAIVLSGSTAAWASRDVGELGRLGEAVLAAGRPTFGICAGMQLLARFAGGAIELGRSVEHGFLPIRAEDRLDLLRDFPDDAVVFHDHTDEIVVLPDGFRVLASTDVCAVQAFADPARGWWGTQFHPEETTAEHPHGARVIENFFALARS
jgi:GMP synthase-like glutamine amidotransferase